jgi:TRAP-type uncharacterized transport system substrate-binding protein
MRSRLMLEIASELVAGDVPGLDYHWPYHQVEINLREQGGEAWRLNFYASDGPDSVDAVMSGKSNFAICNPGGVLAMAVRGTGPFKEPLPLRAITVLPQFDQLGFGVAGKTGLATVADIQRERYPLKISLRGQRDHSVHFITNEVFKVHGFTLDDINAWGGEVRWDEEMPNGDTRLGALERGEIDCLIDEGMPMWAQKSIGFGTEFLAIDEEHLKILEEAGLRRVAITKEEFPGLKRDVWTVDFSGWPVFCRADQPDHIVRAFCIGLENRKDRIPWYGKGPFRTDLFCKSSREAPLDIPLHPAAEHYWRELGYL